MQAIQVVCKKKYLELGICVILPTSYFRSMNKLSVLFIYLVVVNFLAFAGTAPSEKSLGDIIKKVREMYHQGVERTTIAAYITETVDERIKSTNNEEFFEDPLNWFRLLKERNLNTEVDIDEQYNDVANVAWTTGLGNCEENSAIAYYILKKAGVKENIRILRTARHSFTVWDIHPSAIIGEPSTWGDNALVVDPWLGRTTTREEVENGRWFLNNNPDAKLNDYTTMVDSDADSWNTINAEYNRANNIKPKPRSKRDIDEDCFIATAVYGDPNAPNIQVLRSWRDKVLKKTPMGILFVKTYETVGPVFAFYIRKDPARKKWARKYIVEPAVWVSEQTK